MKFVMNITKTRTLMYCS